MLGSLVLIRVYIGCPEGMPQWTRLRSGLSYVVTEASPFVVQKGLLLFPCEHFGPPDI